jgi:hypothetical protein
VNLEPDRYLCPIHQVDLTELVRRQLQDRETADVAFGRPGLNPFRRRAASGPRPFQVEVRCPGAGTPHGEFCEGSYTP